MIRIAIVVCCAALAAAETEANPQLYFNSFGHQQGHFNTYHYPTAMSSYSSYSAFPGYSAYQPRGFASVASYNPAYGYAAAGRYLADSVGAVHMAREKLRLSLRLRPRPRLSPKCSTTPTNARVSLTPPSTPTVTPLSTPDTPGASTSLLTATSDTGTSTERERLMLSLRLRLRLMPFT